MLAGGPREIKKCVRACVAPRATCAPATDGRLVRELRGPGRHRTPATLMTVPHHHARARLTLLALVLVVATVLAPTLARAQQVHVVRTGQSLARIAARYHVRVSDLAAANGLATSAALRPGQELRLSLIHI